MSRFAAFPLLLAFLAGCAQNGAPPGPAANARPRADKEGVGWSHKELLEHLKAKGLSWDDQIGTPDSPYGGPLVGLMRKGDEKMGALMIVLASSPESARETAGATGAFSWGRFLFLSHRSQPGSLYGQARKVLE